MSRPRPTWYYKPASDLLSALTKVRRDMGATGDRLPEEYSNRKQRERAIRTAARVLNRIRVPAEMADAMDATLWARFSNPRKAHPKRASLEDGASSIVSIAKVFYHLHRLLNYDDVPLEEIENIQEELLNLEALSKILPQEDLLKAKWFLQKEAKFSSAVKSQQLVPVPTGERKKLIRFDLDGE